MQKRAVITGVGGQDGSYLAEWLVSMGYEVHGVDPVFASNRQLCGNGACSMIMHKVDVLDSASLVRLLGAVRPAEFYNLAAMSFVPDSAAKPAEAAQINALAVLHILEAIRKVDTSIRYFQASSSQCFGSPNETPQHELTPFRPRDPYAAAKAYAHWLTTWYREQHGLFACCGILFNHESPRRGLQFVTRKITHAAASISLGLPAILRLGNVQARRDWGFAGDYVQAMWKMLQQPIADDFVLGTGVTHSVEEFLDAAFRRLGLRWQDHVVIDPSFFRPEKGLEVAADARKARDVLGWEAKTTFHELVCMMVAADLERVLRAADHAIRSERLAG